MTGLSIDTVDDVVVGAGVENPEAGAPIAPLVDAVGTH